MRPPPISAIACGGKANVVLLTHDSLQFLAPRFVAMRDSLKTLPGVTIVADISPQTVNKEGGWPMMRTILLAHPNVDVVLGADTVVLGALEALRAAGKARPEPVPRRHRRRARGGRGDQEGRPLQGEHQPRLAHVRLCHGPARRRLARRQEHPAGDGHPAECADLANITQYEADLADPGRVYRDPARRAAYLRMYGNICYDTRDQYVNFPWSSERRP
jgi:ribose transport system substrate-binding protein